MAEPQVPAHICWEERPGGGTFVLAFWYGRDGASEAAVLARVLRLLIERYGFTVKLNMLRFGMPPYCTFVPKDGVQVEVAIDDYLGLEVDSNSKDLIEKLLADLNAGGGGAPSVQVPEGPFEFLERIRADSNPGEHKSRQPKKPDLPVHGAFTRPLLPWPPDTAALLKAVKRSLRRKQTR